MDPHRKLWNEEHKQLRQMLGKPEQHTAAIELFLRQHAMVHAGEMSGSGLHSFADEVLEDANESVLRCLPPKSEHSIAWLLWHIARIEDMTMNVLMAGRPQLFYLEDWLAKLNITLRHTGNVVMSAADVRELSGRIDLPALLAYRQAVGRATRTAVRTLQPEAVRRKVDPTRLQALLDDGSVAPEATGLIEYWGNLTISGLLLMPPTRHCLVHLNEALNLKEKATRLLNECKD